MRRISRLTESDLVRLVKKVIRENRRVYEGSDWKMAASVGDKVRDNRVVDRDDWYDEMDSPMNPIDLDMATHGKVFGPDQYEEFMEYINDCDTMWCTKTKKMFDVYQAQAGPISVVKRR